MQASKKTVLCIQTLLLTLAFDIPSFSVISNVWELDPETEPDNLPGHQVIGSTMNKPNINN